MKTHSFPFLLILLACITGTSFSYGQNSEPFTLKEARENTPFEVKRCGHLARMEHAKHNDPDFEKKRAEIEQHTRDYAMGLVSNKTTAILTIPVVVHVIYRNATQNITDAQIMSQMDVLNEDFRRQNSDTGSTPASFVGVAADTEIEFCLASVDPGGLPTTGITRTSTTVAEIGNANFYTTSSGGKDAWNTTQYLNIWVCEIESGGGLLGFATPPGTAGPNDDGVVIDYRFMGTMGTVSAPMDLGRTGTHEVGHYLNLEHIWGLYGGCGDDDLVGDTPDQEFDNFGCPGSATSCGSADMFMNYMDYTDDNCMNIFTQGQKTRMVAALTGPRAALLTSSGCGGGVTGREGHCRDQ